MPKDVVCHLRKGFALKLTAPLRAEAAVKRLRLVTPQHHASPVPPATPVPPAATYESGRMHSDTADRMLTPMCTPFVRCGTSPKFPGASVTYLKQINKKESRSEQRRSARGEFPLRRVFARFKFYFTANDRENREGEEENCGFLKCVRAVLLREKIFLMIFAKIYKLWMFNGKTKWYTMLNALFEKMTAQSERL